MRVRLLLFAKAPVAGAVKTRLVPALSPARAAALHAALTSRALATAVAAGIGEVELWRAGDDRHPFWRELTADHAVALRRQHGGDLGTRMHHAITAALKVGDSAIVIGSDCPALDVDYLRTARGELARGADVVLGPATDGGYVLIGLRRCERSLFNGIEWGCSDVLQRTIAAIDRLGWRYRLLAPLADIDRPADLHHLPADLRALYPSGQCIEGTNR